MRSTRILVDTGDRSDHGLAVSCFGPAMADPLMVRATEGSRSSGAQFGAPPAVGEIQRGARPRCLTADPAEVAGLVDNGFHAGPQAIAVVGRGQAPDQSSEVENRG